MDNKIFGNILKSERLNIGLTQNQLAIKIGVSNQAISYYEKGSKQPSLDKLSALADIFGCTTDYLLGRVEHREGVIHELKDSKHTYKLELQKDFTETLTLEDVYKLIERLNDLGVDVNKIIKD